MKIFAAFAICVTLFSQGYSNTLDSCQGRCGYGTDSNYSCQCNPSCERFKDCCSDYVEFCKVGSTSCKDRCGEKYNSQNKCHCNYKCPSHNNCCSDYAELCEAGSMSCKGRCGENYNPQNKCHCNSKCPSHNNCCSDYAELCEAGSMSCKGRCGENYNPQNKCHCNSKCPSHNNCCSDYAELCDGGGGGGGGGSDVTDAEIKAISETLFALDSNKASASELIIDPQALVPDSQTGSQTDHSSMPLYKYVNEEVLFSKPTYAAFVAVLDNYQRMTGQTENFSPEQLAEQETFINETMSNTELGRELFAFLSTKGFYATEEEFHYDLKMMWFGLYSRYNNKMDSSGFEHIFAGEVKKGKVSGFHNWIQFYLLEKRGQLNYYSHSFDGPWTSYPDVLGMQFMWDGYYKQVGSAIIGCSPEFDFALYSLCYITRPGKQCRLSLGGKELFIQTYTWNNSSYGNGKKYIGSAFPATPRN